MPLSEKQLLETLSVDIVANYVVLQIGVPVELDGARYVALLVKEDIFVRFYDA